MIPSAELRALSNELARRGIFDLSERADHIAVVVVKMERTLDEIVADARQDAVAAERSANVVFFQRPRPGIRPGIRSTPPDIVE